MYSTRIIVIKVNIYKITFCIYTVAVSFVFVFKSSFIELAHCSIQHSFSPLQYITSEFKSKISKALV